MSTQASSEESLEKLLRKRILENGPISFRGFMEMALYEPGLGYYMSESQKIGWGGDFYTSPDLHPAFASSIAAQLDEMHSLLGREERLLVVEAGAGKGLLCAQLLECARNKFPHLYSMLDYIIVEISPSLRTVQKETIGEGAGEGAKVRWSDTIETALEGAASAVVFSNELMDAFPVHKVVMDKGQWKEVFVGLDEVGFCEIYRDLSDPLISLCLEKVEGPFHDGYTTEVNLDALKWMQTAGDCLVNGFIITIDYGYSRDDYYAPERSSGTLLCYYRHQLSENPYERIGEQDITTHVDFSSLAEAGKESGLETIGYCDQFHFLMGLGVFDEFKSMEEDGAYNVDSYAENQSIKSLLMPENMGGTFKVLIQAKGLHELPSLKAFAFRNKLNRL